MQNSVFQLAEGDDTTEVKSQETSESVAEESSALKTNNLVSQFIEAQHYEVFKRIFIGYI